MVTQQRAEETRNRLLTAAVDCFASQGYDAASVAEICRAAGVSKGAFYHHFASKQGLFVDLLNDWLGKLDVQLDTARLGAATVPEGIKRMAEHVRPVFALTNLFIPMFLEFLIQASREPAIWQVTIEPYRRYREIFAGMIRAGVAEGSLRPVDPEMTARVIVSLAVGLLLQSVFSPDEADWGQVAQEGIQLLLDGLASQETAPDGDAVGPQDQSRF